MQLASLPVVPCAASSGTVTGADHVLICSTSGWVGWGLMEGNEQPRHQDTAAAVGRVTLRKPGRGGTGAAIQEWFKVGVR